MNARPHPHVIRRPYEPEQRAQAVERALALREGETISSVAQDLGVNPSTLHYWVQAAAKAMAAGDDETTDTTEKTGTTETTDTTPARTNMAATKKTRRNYPEDFKAGAVKRVKEGEHPTDVAAHLGVHVTVLRAWMEKAGVRQGRVSARAVPESAPVNQLTVPGAELAQHSNGHALVPASNGHARILSQDESAYTATLRAEIESLKRELRRYKRIAAAAMEEDLLG